MTALRQINDDILNFITVLNITHASQPHNPLLITLNAAHTLLTTIINDFDNATIPDDLLSTIFSSIVNILVSPSSISDCTIKRIVLQTLSNWFINGTITALFTTLQFSSNPKIAKNRPSSLHLSQKSQNESHTAIISYLLQACLFLSNSFHVNQPDFHHPLETTSEPAPYTPQPEYLPYLNLPVTCKLFNPQEHLNIFAPSPSLTRTPLPSSHDLLLKNDHYINSTSPHTNNPLQPNASNAIFAQTSQSPQLTIQRSSSIHTPVPGDTYSSSTVTNAQVNLIQDRKPTTSTSLSLQTFQNSTPSPHHPLSAHPSALPIQFSQTIALFNAFTNQSSLAPFSSQYPHDTSTSHHHIHPSHDTQIPDEHSMLLTSLTLLHHIFEFATSTSFILHTSLLWYVFCYLQSLYIHDNLNLHDYNELGSLLKRQITTTLSSLLSYTATISPQVPLSDTLYSEMVYLPLVESYNPVTGSFAAPRTFHDPHQTPSTPLVISSAQLSYPYRQYSRSESIGQLHLGVESDPTKFISTFFPVFSHHLAGSYDFSQVQLYLRTRTINLPQMDMLNAQHQHQRSSSLLPSPDYDLFASHQTNNLPPSSQPLQPVMILDFPHFILPAPPAPLLHNPRSFTNLLTLFIISLSHNIGLILHNPNQFQLPKSLFPPQTSSYPAAHPSTPSPSAPPTPHPQATLSSFINTTVHPNLDKPFHTLLLQPHTTKIPLTVHCLRVLQTLFTSFTPKSTKTLSPLIGHALTYALYPVLTVLTQFYVLPCNMVPILHSTVTLIAHNIFRLLTTLIRFPTIQADTVGLIACIYMPIYEQLCASLQMCTISPSMVSLLQDQQYMNTLKTQVRLFIAQKQKSAAAANPALAAQSSSDAPTPTSPKPAQKATDNDDDDDDEDDKAAKAQNGANEGALNPTVNFSVPKHLTLPVQPSASSNFITNHLFPKRNALNQSLALLLIASTKELFSSPELLVALLKHTDFALIGVSLVESIIFYNNMIITGSFTQCDYQITTNLINYSIMGAVSNQNLVQYTQAAKLNPFDESSGNQKNLNNGLETFENEPTVNHLPLSVLQNYQVFNVAELNKNELIAPFYTQVGADNGGSSTNNKSGDKSGNASGSKAASSNSQAVCQATPANSILFLENTTQYISQHLLKQYYTNLNQINALADRNAPQPQNSTQNLPNPNTQSVQDPQSIPQLTLQPAQQQQQQQQQQQPAQTQLTPHTMAFAQNQSYLPQTMCKTIPTSFGLHSLIEPLLSNVVVTHLSASSTTASSSTESPTQSQSTHIHSNTDPSYQVPNITWIYQAVLDHQLASDDENGAKSSQNDGNGDDSRNLAETQAQNQPLANLSRNDPLTSLNPKVFKKIQAITRILEEYCATSVALTTTTTNKCNSLQLNPTTSTIFGLPFLLTSPYLQTTSNIEHTGLPQRSTQPYPFDTSSTSLHLLSTEHYISPLGVLVSASPAQNDPQNPQSNPASAPNPTNSQSSQPNHPYHPSSAPFYPVFDPMHQNPQPTQLSPRPDLFLAYSTIQSKSLETIGVFYQTLFSLATAALQRTDAERLAAFYTKNSQTVQSSRNNDPNTSFIESNTSENSTHQLQLPTSSSHSSLIFQTAPVQSHFYDLITTHRADFMQNVQPKPSFPLHSLSSHSPFQFTLPTHSTTFTHHLSQFKKVQKVASRLFNTFAIQSIPLLISLGFIPKNPHPFHIVTFLSTTVGINKVVLGEVIAGRGKAANLLLHAIIHLLIDGGMHTIQRPAVQKRSTQFDGDNNGKERERSQTATTPTNQRSILDDDDDDDDDVDSTLNSSQSHDSGSEVDDDLKSSLLPHNLSGVIVTIDGTKSTIAEYIEAAVQGYLHSFNYILPPPSPSYTTPPSQQAPPAQPSLAQIQTITLPYQKSPTAKKAELNLKAAYKAKLALTDPNHPCLIAPEGGELQRVELPVPTYQSIKSIKQQHDERGIEAQQQQHLENGQHSALLAQNQSKCGESGKFRKKMSSFDEKRATLASIPPILPIFRRIAEAFRFPSEPQPIDRIVQALSTVYYTKYQQLCLYLFNYPTFEQEWPWRTEDAVFVTIFSIVMLTTDLHNKALSADSAGTANSSTGSTSSSSSSSSSSFKRMTIDEYCRNLRGVNGDQDIPRPYLEAIYGSILNEKLDIFEYTSLTPPILSYEPPMVMGYLGNDTDRRMFDKLPRDASDGGNASSNSQSRHNRTQKGQNQDKTVSADALIMPQAKVVQTGPFTVLPSTLYNIIQARIRANTSFFDITTNSSPSGQIYQLGDKIANSTVCKSTPIPPQNPIAAPSQCELIQYELLDMVLPTIERYTPLLFQSLIHILHQLSKSTAILSKLAILLAPPPEQHNPRHPGYPPHTNSHYHFSSSPSDFPLTPTTSTLSTNAISTYRLTEQSFLTSMGNILQLFATFIQFSTQYQQLSPSHPHFHAPPHTSSNPTPFISSKLKLYFSTFFRAVSRYLLHNLSLTCLVSSKRFLSFLYPPHSLYTPATQPLITTTLLESPDHFDDIRDIDDIDEECSTLDVPTSGENEHTRQSAQFDQNENINETYGQKNGSSSRSSINARNPRRDHNLDDTDAILISTSTQTTAQFVPIAPVQPSFAQLRSNPLLSSNSHYFTANDMKLSYFDPLLYAPDVVSANSMISDQSGDRNATIARNALYESHHSHAQHTLTDINQYVLNALHQTLNNGCIDGDHLLILSLHPQDDADLIQVLHTTRIITPYSQQQQQQQQHTQSSHSPSETPPLWFSPTPLSIPSSTQSQSRSDQLQHFILTPSLLHIASHPILRSLLTSFFTFLKIASTNLLALLAPHKWSTLTDIFILMSRIGLSNHSTYTSYDFSSTIHPYLTPSTMSSQLHLNPTPSSSSHQPLKNKLILSHHILAHFFPSAPFPYTHILTTYMSMKEEPLQIQLPSFFNAVSAVTSWFWSPTPTASASAQSPGGATQQTADGSEQARDHADSASLAESNNSSTNAADRDRAANSSQSTIAPGAVFQTTHKFNQTMVTMYPYSKHTPYLAFQPGSGAIPGSLDISSPYVNYTNGTQKPQPQTHSPVISPSQFVSTPHNSLHQLPSFELIAQAQYRDNATLFTVNNLPTNKLPYYSLHSTPFTPFKFSISSHAEITPRAGSSNSNFSALTAVASTPNQVEFDNTQKHVLSYTNASFPTVFTSNPTTPHQSFSTQSFFHDIAPKHKPLATSYLLFFHQFLQFIPQTYQLRATLCLNTSTAHFNDILAQYRSFTQLFLPRCNSTSLLSQSTALHQTLTANLITSPTNAQITAAAAQSLQQTQPHLPTDPPPILSPAQIHQHQHTINDTKQHIQEAYLSIRLYITIIQHLVSELVPFHASNRDKLINDKIGQIEHNRNGNNDDSVSDAPSPANSPTLNANLSTSFNKLIFPLINQLVHLLQSNCAQYQHFFTKYHSITHTIHSTQPHPYDDRDTLHTQRQYTHTDSKKTSTASTPQHRSHSSIKAPHHEPQLSPEDARIGLQLNNYALQQEWFETNLTLLLQIPYLFIFAFPAQSRSTTDLLPPEYISAVSNAHFEAVQTVSALFFAPHQQPSQLPLSTTQSPSTSTHLPPLHALAPIYAPRLVCSTLYLFHPNLAQYLTSAQLHAVESNLTPLLKFSSTPVLLLSHIEAYLDIIQSDPYLYTNMTTHSETALTTETANTEPKSPSFPTYLKTLSTLFSQCYMTLLRAISMISYQNAKAMHSERTSNHPDALATTLSPTLINSTIQSLSSMKFDGLISLAQNLSTASLSKHQQSPARSKITQAKSTPNLKLLLSTLVPPTPPTSFTPPTQQLTHPASPRSLSADQLPTGQIVVSDPQTTTSTSNKVANPNNAADSPLQAHPPPDNLSTDILLQSLITIHTAFQSILSTISTPPQQTTQQSTQTHGLTLPADQIHSLWSDSIHLFGRHLLHLLDEPIPVITPSSTTRPTGLVSIYPSSRLRFALLQTLVKCITSYFQFALLSNSPIVLTFIDEYINALLFPLLLRYLNQLASYIIINPLSFTTDTSSQSHPPQTLPHPLPVLLPAVDAQPQNGSLVWSISYLSKVILQLSGKLFPILSSTIHHPSNQAIGNATGLMKRQCHFLNTLSIWSRHCSSVFSTLLELSIYLQPRQAGQGGTAQSSATPNSNQPSPPHQSQPQTPPQSTLFTQQADINLHVILGVYRFISQSIKQLLFPQLNPPQNQQNQQNQQNSTQQPTNSNTTTPQHAQWLENALSLQDWVTIMSTCASDQQSIQHHIPQLDPNAISMFSTLFKENTFHSLFDQSIFSTALQSTHTTTLYTPTTHPEWFKNTHFFLSVFFISALPLILPSIKQQLLTSVPIKLPEPALTRQTQQTQQTQQQQPTVEPPSQPLQQHQASHQ